MESLKLTDFLDYQYLSALEMAPDEEHSVFVVSHAEEEENTYRSSLYLYEHKTGTVRRLTALEQENNPCWLDGSTVLFPSMRDKNCKARVEKGEHWSIFYTIDIHGGEATEYMRVPYAVSKVVPLGDDKFLMTVRHENNGINLHQYEGLEKQKQEKLLEQNRDYEVLTEIPYWANGGGFTDSVRSRLYIYDKKADSMTPITGEWDDAEYCDNQNGKVLYVSHYFRGKAASTVGIFQYDTASQKTTTLLDDGTYSVNVAGYLDGRVFCTATDMLHYGINENQDFYWVENGKLTPWAQHDLGYGSGVGSDCRLGGGHSWQVYDHKLYFLSTEGYYTYLKSLDVSGKMETLTKPNGSVDSIAVSKDEILFIGLRGMRLQELYRLKDAQETQITTFNESIVETKTLSKPEHISFENDGVALDGWVMKPIGFDPAQKYPAIFDIHGGPKSAYGDIFYHEMQLWANRGYFVFFCNPRGGNGKGNVFADIRGKYGTIDYEDLMAFTDLVLKQNPQIDPDRVGVTGGSYGGFMTNWIIGHTNRFKCAASQRSISNWISMFCTTDIGYYFAEDQNCSTPWENDDKLWWHSPLRYADKVTTPTLFIHSEQDYRCWLTEGLQMFTALKYHGVESRLCMFRGENHELSRSGKPRHRVRRLEEITQWFEEHLK